MTDPISPPVGNVAREAIASRRGYLYQDYQAALQWLELKDDERLYLEVAEDFVVVTPSDLAATQVKDVAEHVTLNSADAKQALASFVQLVNAHPSKQIRFSYLSTTIAGRERALHHRAGGEGSIAYWQSVKSVDDMPPLRKVLLALELDPAVTSFISSRDDATLLSELILPFAWQLGREPIDPIAKDLENQLAARLFREFQLPRAQGRKFVGSLLHEVMTATLRPREERFLDATSLRDFLESLATRTLKIGEYEELLVKATVAENLPIDVLDERVLLQQNTLRQCRRFNGYDGVGAARALAEAVRLGGPYAGASASVRADAFAWAARSIIDEDRAEAEDLVEEGRRICETEMLAVADAILGSKVNLPQALSKIAGLHSPAAHTGRYVMHFRSRDGLDGTHAALQWLRDAGLEVSDLDEDGQAAALGDLMRVGNWDEALRTSSQVFAGPTHHPMLLLDAATAQLASAVIEPRRHEIIGIPPVVDHLEFPLLATPSAMTARDKAQQLFARLQQAADDLKMPGVAAHAREYLLWLSVHDQPNHVEVRAQIEALLQAPDDYMRWVPLALSCNMPLDVAAIQERVWQHVAREGKAGYLASRALLALMLAGKPEPDSDPWRRAKPYLLEFFDSQMLTSLEVQMDVKAGRPVEARARLDDLGDSEAAERMRSHLMTMIDAGLGSDVVAERRKAYEGNPEIFELEQLILALGSAGRWDELKGYTNTLFSLAPTLENAERLAEALLRTNDWTALEAFADANPGLLHQSSRMADIASHLQINLARWPALQDTLSTGKLSLRAARSRRRAMHVLSLQWHELNAEVDTALRNPTTEEAGDLLELAVTAMVLERNADAKQLTRAAVAAAPDDAAILMAAYLQATKGMWEDADEVGGWLRRAIELSGDNGPVQAKSMKELIELAPAWKEESASTWSGLQNGDIWLFAYAKLLNQQLSGVTLMAAKRNLTEIDTRRRSIIPAFSGIRVPESMKGVTCLAVDPTALLTLGRLGLLEALSSSIERLQVPHYTGLWLFEEFQQASFHQPRHFEDARRILGLIAQEKLRICPRVRIVDKLTSQVGEELATLLRQAQADIREGKSAYVIRSTPVHTVNSMMEGTADLREYTDVLRSTLCLANAMEAAGAASLEAVESAQMYLRQVDNGWPDEKPIVFPATLYLDDLTVTYLQHVGLLELLTRTGCRLVVHEHVRTQAKSYEAARGAQSELLEGLTDIRNFLSAGIAQGKIDVLPAARQRRGRTRSEILPEIDLLQPGLPTEAILVDDRFFNRFRNIEHAGHPAVKVFTSLDFLDLLRDANAINEKRWRSLRTDLRRAGYAFVPLTEDEVREATTNLRIVDGRIVEPVELRAIRENATLIQLRQILQVPAEMPWLTAFMEAIRAFLEAVWLGDLKDEARVSELTRWTLNLIDLRNFAARFPEPMTQERWRALGLIPLGRFLTHCLMAKPSKRRRKMLATEIFERMEWRDPLAIELLLRMVSEAIVGLQTDLQQSANGDEKTALAFAVFRLANELPAPLERALKADDTRANAFGLELERQISLKLPGTPKFERDALWEAAAAVLHGGPPVEVKDLSGHAWTIKAAKGKGNVAVRDDLPPLNFSDAAMMSPNSVERLDYLRDSAARAGIGTGAIPERFLKAIQDRPLTPSELDDLQEFFKLNPLPLFEDLCQEISDGHTTLNRLIPLQLAYYERLIGPWRGEQSVIEFAVAGPPHPAEASAQNRLWLASLRCGHSLTGPHALIANTSSEDFKAFVAKFTPSLDVWGLTGLLEGLMLQSNVLNDYRAELTNLLSQFNAVMTTDRLKLTSSLFTAIDTRIRKHAPHVPPFWRRLAAAAHVALIERVLVTEGAELGATTRQMSSLGRSFNALGVIDMWQEPKWAPFLVAGHQLEQELIGRVLNGWIARFKGADDETIGPELLKLIAVLQERRNVFSSAMPGPVEGNVKRYAADPAVNTHALDVLANQDLALVDRWMSVCTLALAVDLSTQVLVTFDAQLSEFGLDELSAQSEEYVRELLARAAYIAAMNADKTLAKTVLGLSRRLFLETEGSIESSICLYVGAILSAAERQRDEQVRALVECVSFCAQTCRTKEDASRCLSLLDGFVEGDWSLGPKLAGEAAALRSLARNLS